MYVLKRKPYYIATILFNLLSIILVILAYHFNLLGYKDVPLEYVLLIFLKETHFNPIDFTFIILIAILLLVALIQKINVGEKEKIMFPNTKKSHIFMITLLSFMYGIILYLYLTQIGSGSLVGFLIIFANMALFHYIYPLIFHE